jgi:hypothetical protein
MAPLAMGLQQRTMPLVDHGPWCGHEFCGRKHRTETGEPAK